MHLDKQVVQNHTCFVDNVQNESRNMLVCTKKQGDILLFD